MNRRLIVLAAALLLLGSLARLSCPAGEEEPAAPIDATAKAAAPDRADFVAPGTAEKEGREEEGREEQEREAVATPDPEPVEPESRVAAPDADPPLLLAGLVVDGLGTGVPDATVQVERRTTDTGGFGMRSVAVEPLPKLQARTDAQGRFAVRGEESGTVFVSAVKAGYVLRGEVECTLPDTGVTLVLDRSGAILVTVAPPAHELAKGVDVEVRPTGGERDVHGSTSRFQAGRALREKLVPGPYDVVVVGRVSRRVLLTVPGVQAREGETTEDPRLQDLDLRGALQAIRVAVVDPDERPMADVTVWVHHGFGERGQRTGDDGSIELVAGPDGVDVAVRESGWRRVQHRAVTEDLVIRLERPLALELVRPRGRSSELGDLYLYVERVPVEGDTDSPAGGSDWALRASADTVLVALDGAGTYRVLWAAVLNVGKRGTANIYPLEVTPQTIEVAEGAGTQEVMLALETATVDAMIGRVAALTEELKLEAGETASEHERRVMQILMRESRR